MPQRTHARTAFAGDHDRGAQRVRCALRGVRRAGQGGGWVVDKVVEGEAPPGTQYTIRLSCVTEANPVPQISQVVLDGPGNADRWPDRRRQHVHDHRAGGRSAATSVTFSCEVTSGAGGVRPGRQPDHVPDRECVGRHHHGHQQLRGRRRPRPEPAAEALVLEPAFTG